MVLPALTRSLRAATATLALCGALAPQVGVLQSLEPLTGNPHVIIIIVDGLRPDLISAERTPTLQRLVDEGASTLDARTVRPSVTLPSITSMMTGLRPQDHGVTWNDYEPEKGTVTATTIFDVAHDAGLRTAFFSGKVKIRHTIHAGSLDVESVRFLPDASLVILARAALEEQQPALLLVHLPNVDRTGHEFGWDSEEQRATLYATDIAIATILQVVDSGVLNGPVRLIVTADHGGEGKNHQRRRRINETVPWLIWGDGVESRSIDPVSVTLTAAAALRSLGLELPANIDTGGY